MSLVSRRSGPLRALAVAWLVATFACLAAFVAAPAQSDPYGPAVTPTCGIGLSVTAADRVIVRAEVTAAGNIVESGEIRIRVRSLDRNGATVWSAVRAYAGSPIQVTRPVVSAGSYRADLQFLSTTPQLNGCTASAQVRVGAEVGGIAEDPAGPADGAVGGLPDTGGPDRMLLAVGLLLVVGGGLLARQGTQPRYRGRHALA